LDTRFGLDQASIGDRLIPVVGGNVELYDTVRLLVDLPEEGLAAGAIGAVVHVFDKPNLAYEVEFTDGNGRTIAQIPLPPDQLRPIASSDA
jgi:hypothetical protein